MSEVLNEKTLKTISSKEATMSLFFNQLVRRLRRGLSNKEAARRPRLSRRFTPVIERFADRIVPTVLPDFSGTVVTLTSNPDGDTITVSTGFNDEILNGNSVILNSAGTIATLTNTTKIRVFGNGGDDIIDLSGLIDFSGSVRIDGGADNDELIGSWGADVILGGSGRDTLNGFFGNDDLNGGQHNDELYGSWGNDALHDSAGDDTFDGGVGDDTLVGMDSADNVFTVTGTNEGDLNGESFISVENLESGAGDDTFDLGQGDITGSLKGGGGRDTLTYASTTFAGVTVNLTTGSASRVGGQVSQIENLTGGPGSDVLIGDNADNVLDGGGGSNTLEGRRGDDTLIDGMGSDTFDGGAGNDTLVGRDDVDNSFLVTGLNKGTVNGEEFEEVENLNSGGGSDTFAFSYEIISAAPFGSVLVQGRLDGWVNGGFGVNTLNYASSLSGVTVDLTTGSATNIGSGIELQTGSIWNVIGSSLSDTLTGDGNYNVLVGKGGNDTIDGGAGRDVVIGGTGADTLLGGVGEDVLIGGSTVHDNAPDALRDLGAAWYIGGLYLDRVNALRTGLLAPANVTDDGATDTMTGDATDLDYFIGESVDVITDLDAFDEEDD